MRRRIFLSLDSKGEFLLTLMSSLAEEESRSISENVRWGQRKRFADGRYHMPYKQFLGYKKGANGEPELVEEEAKIIRIIYRLFLEGYTPSSIAKQLTKQKYRLLPGTVYGNGTRLKVSCRMKNITAQRCYRRNSALITAQTSVKTKVNYDVLR